MKRYALFCFDAHHPAGGWGDFEGSFDTVPEAVAAGTAKNRDMFEVVDLTTGEEVDIG